MPSIRTIESIGLICVAHTETSQQRIPSRIHTYGWCGRACMHVLPLYVCVSKYWSGDLYGRGNTLTCLVALKYSSLVSLQQILQIYFGAQITRKFILSTIFFWIWWNYRKVTQIGYYCQMKSIDFVIISIFLWWMDMSEWNTVSIHEIANSFNIFSVLKNETSLAIHSNY